MKRLSLFSVLLLPSCAAAQATLGEGAAGAATLLRDARRATPVVSSVGELPFHDSWLKVDACWERSADADADALGLPKRFCLRRLGHRTAADSHPLGWRSSALVESDFAEGSLHVSGALRENDGWAPVANLWDDGRTGAGTCGALSRAFAAVYYRIDLGGNMKPGPLEVRGFLMGSGALCAKPAKTREFLYQKISAPVPAGSPIAR
ncbi:MAG: hypothetical protein WC969_01645 [Elusimicrobiota bacterium]|jgi:hypothetical protein